MTAQREASGHLAQLDIGRGSRTLPNKKNQVSIKGALIIMWKIFMWKSLWLFSFYLSAVRRLATGGKLVAM